MGFKFPHRVRLPVAPKQSASHAAGASLAAVALVFSAEPILIYFLRAQRCRSPPHWFRRSRAGVTPGVWKYLVRLRLVDSTSIRAWLRRCRPALVQRLRFSQSGLRRSRDHGPSR